IGDGNAELMLFIALAVQRQDGETARFDKLQHRTGNGRERRLLVVASIKSVQHPIQTREADGRTDAWVQSVLAEAAFEMREPQSSSDAQPLSRPVLIAD